MKHIKGLDTIRAFAILLVIMGHWGVPFNAKHPVGSFLQSKIIPDGTFGVDLFFVLSGFLITSILLQIKTEAKEGELWQGVRSFFIRRVLRIFPIYYLTIFLLLAINYAGVREFAGYYLTFTSNILIYKTSSWWFIPHTWSLAVEEQFYLFWPWLILFISWKYLKYLFYAAMLFSIVGSYITFDVLHKGEFPILVYNCLICFALGGYYAYTRMVSMSYRRFESILLPAFAGSVLLYFHWKFFHGVFWQHTTFLFRTVEGIISLQLIVWVINNRSEWVRKYILENRVLNFIGMISYGIYLYHNILQPVFDGYIERARLRHPGMPFWVYNYYGAYAEKLLLLFFISWLSYRYIERPLLSLKDKFPYKKK